MLIRIEGHGALKINFQENKASLIIEEGERLFEALIIGKSYQEVPAIVSRICGICPIVHNLCAIKTFEDIFNFTPHNSLIGLRQLLLCAQIIHSHIIHLFFFALPDYVDIKNSLALIKKYPAEYHLILNLKRICEEIFQKIAGAEVHPVFTKVGGFSKIPSKDALSKISFAIEQIFDEACDLVKLFAGLSYPYLNRETEYLCLDNDKEYSLYDGLISSNKGLKESPKNYQKIFDEKVIDNLPAKIAERFDRGFMVGALARISLQKERLNPQAKNITRKLNLQFPTFNSFHNNLAQAVEVLHFLEEAYNVLDYLRKQKLENSLPKKLELKKAMGVVALEAPRGTLYYEFKVNKEGYVAYANIITPTVQNLKNLEEDANWLLKNTKNQSASQRRHLLEMLIRAYDPCITCSVH